MARNISVVYMPPKLVKKKRVAAYARVSSGKDAMLHSLSAQVSYYSNLIQTRNEWLFAGVYVDEAISGTKDCRNDFQRLIDDCKTGKIDMVITKSISRFARNTVTLLQTIRELKSLGVDVFFEEQNIHTMSGDGELMLSILASYAQEESRSVSENQKWQIRHGFEKGELINWRFMFGYSITKDCIEINPEQAEIVREVFQRVINGETLGSISCDLNERKIDRAQGGKWCTQRIREMIMNEKYLGNSLLQKHYRNNYLEKKKTLNLGELPMYLVEESHDPIIDKETFQKANNVLKCLQEQTIKRPKPTQSVFTGKIRCPLCGKNYKRVKYRGHFGWNCSTYHKKGRSVCFGKFIPEEILKAKSVTSMGLNEFDEAAFHKQISFIEVPEPNHLVFMFHDGRKLEQIWEDRSRAASWTPEMKEKARQRSILKKQ